MSFSAVNIASICRSGLWQNNPGLVQILGLCPLIALSNNGMNALIMGIATTFVLIIANFIVAVGRKFIPYHQRIPIFVAIIAAAVIGVQLVLAAINYSLYLHLGLFLALITTNCIIIGRLETFAYRRQNLSIIFVIFDALMQGIGFTLVLLILGCIREIIGQGTLFSIIKVNIFFTHRFILATLPAGAFVAMGCLLALKNRFMIENENSK